MNEDSLSMLLTVARHQLDAAYPPPLVTPLTPAQLEKVVSGMPAAALLPMMDEPTRALHLKEVARRLELEQRVQIAEPTVLRNDFQEWYFGDRKLPSVRRQWERYRQYLRHEQQFDARTIASVDKSSDAVLAGIGDPHSSLPFDQRGLVVGQVQSGKTTSYAAVINKAIDAGYRIIIVLTGLHEGLRMQTQTRIEESVRGLATESDRPDGTRKDSPLPLLRYGQLPEVPVPMTTRATSGDFSQEAHHYASLAGSAPVIFVIKKNAVILRHVQKFFGASHIKRTHDPLTGRNEIAHLPLLLIDDEADAASIDTKKKKKKEADHDPATINKEIRRLLLQFRQRSYVAYTATPYANILIHKDNVTETEGRDLFPKDFVVMLPAPSNYVGPGTFFGHGQAESDTAPPDLLRDISDCSRTGAGGDDDWMPLLHKKTHTPSFGGKAAIPPSLETAVLTFLFAVTTRRYRGKTKAHNSMLVHVSRFTDVQGLVRTQIEEFIYELKGVFAGISSDVAVRERLERTWDDFTAAAATIEEHERGALPSWTEVLQALPDVLELIEVRQVNSLGGGLDYDSKSKALNVIAVGGDKLSRGLTLEGLSVSYFLRATKMYDTLLQMGRWFGYRPGYKDLCRLFLTRDLREAYGHVTKADEELRAEFRYMQSEQLKPQDYGLRVQSHPKLMVTAQNKMNSAEVRSLDFGGRVTQTIHFFRHAPKLEHNHQATTRFLDAIKPHRDGAPVRRNNDGTRLAKQAAKGALFRRVPTNDVDAFLKDFVFHPGSRRIGGDRLLEYLRAAWEVGVATNWSVIVVDGPGERLQLGELNIGAVKRLPTAMTPWNPSLADEVSINVLSNPTDLVGDLSDDAAAKFVTTSKEFGEESPENEQVLRTRACGVRGERDALLVIYAVQPRLTNNSKTEVAMDFDPNSTARPIGLAFVLPGSNKLKLPTYVENSVLFDKFEEALAAEDDE